MERHASAVISAVQRDFSVVPLEERFADTFAAMKRAFRDTNGQTKEQMKKHNVDFMITSSAMGIGGMVVSNDGLFTQLAKSHGLQVENWNQKR